MYGHVKCNKETVTKYGKKYTATYEKQRYRK
jgi:hypothetical protein